MLHNKLVRDNIIKKIESNWEKAKRHTAGEAEFELKLLGKLVEESIELQDSQDIEELKKEIADVLEVTEEIIKFYWFNTEEIKKIQDEKREKNWWFSKKIILEETE